MKRRIVEVMGVVALVTFAMHRQAYSLEGKWVSERGFTIKFRPDHTFRLIEPYRSVEGEWRANWRWTGFDIELQSDCHISEIACRWVDPDTVDLAGHDLLRRLPRGTPRPSTVYRLKATV